MSSSSNLRDSTALPLSSVLPAKLIPEDILIDVPNEKNRFGWANQIEREPSPPSNVDRIPSGRVEGNLPASVYSDYYKGQKGGQYDIMEDDHDYSLEIYEQEKGLQINNKFETDPMSALEDRRKTDVLKKRRDLPAFEANYSSDDDLNALLKVITF